MSELLALELLIAVLAFAAGLVFRDLAWLLTSWRKRETPAVFGATGEVHPGEAVVFDWSDPRPTFGRGAIAPNADGALGRHLAAVPDER